jgi:putative zinc finger protein
MSEEPDTQFEGILEPAQLARLANEERRRQGDHPPTERLTAYKAGDLPAAEVEALQAHLAVCRRCTRTLLDLSSFYREAEATVIPAPQPTRASWPHLKDRLAAAERRRRVPPERQTHGFQKEQRHSPRFITIVALVASLATNLIGLSVWMVTPSVVAPSLVVYLAPSEVTRGTGEERGLDIELPGHYGGSLTVVCPAPAPRLATYKVEIQPFHGRGAPISPVVIRQAEAASPVPSLTVEFPAERLAPGDYRLVISSPRGEPLAEWRLHLRQPG